jgi:hypothetical protein
MKQRTLTRARLPYQRDLLALGDFEVELVENDQLRLAGSVDFGEVDGPNCDRHACCGHPTPILQGRKIDPLFLGKDLAKREFDRRVESLEDAARNLLSNLLGSFRGRGRVGRLSTWIQYPHVGYSHGEVVVDDTLNAALLDAGPGPEVWRLRKQFGQRYFDTWIFRAEDAALDVAPALCAGDRPSAASRRVEDPHVTP